MADREFRFAPFTPADLDLAGVASVTRSGAVQSALSALAEPMAASANDAAIARRTPPERHYLTRDPYAARVRVLSKTAVGLVSTASGEGQRDQAEHHTLDSLNH